MYALATWKSPARLMNVATWSLLLLSGGCQNHVDSPEGSVAPRTEALREDAAQLRAYIAQQVGGLEKLKVPADDSSIPLPAPDPARPGRYDTTEAKRVLGKMLFHDPVRTVRIDVNSSSVLRRRSGRDNGCASLRSENISVFVGPRRFCPLVARSWRR